MCDQDKKLLTQIGEGGKVAEQAFVTLDTKYRAMMHSVLRQKYTIYDASIREDIIQDTFVSIFKKQQSFRQDSSVKTWIFSILKNKAKDYFRKQQTHKKLIQAQVEQSDQAQTDSNNPAKQNKYDCENQVIEAFRKQHPEHFSQLMQIVWNGLSLKQLATLENIEYGAARERISNLRKKLRALIELHCSNNS